MDILDEGSDKETENTQRKELEIVEPEQDKAMTGESGEEGDLTKEELL